MKSKTVKITGLLTLLVICIAMMAVGIALVLKKGKSPQSDKTSSETDSPNTEGTSNMEDKDPTDLSEYISAVADKIYAGNESDARSHGLKLSNTVSTVRMNAATGTISEDYNVWRFSGKGAFAEWTMNLGNGGSEEYVMLEIQEVHEANIETFGYTVYVDGEETYFRTYEQISSSPNHYFIAIRKSDISNLSNVTIRIESADDNPFSISKVWIYNEFFTNLANQGIDGSMMIYLHSADSLNLAKEHISDFSDMEYKNFDLGLMFKIGYMNDTDEEAVSKVVSYLNLAAENGMNLQFMPSLSWSAPYDIADGKGGSFTDVKYGQVLYNSLTGEWVDSTPNAYGNTQWCSWGNPTLLQAQTTRISNLWSLVTSYLYSFRASGKYTGNISTLIEHSVVYKGPMPQTSYYTMGEIDGGDFNPVVIAAAKADGIVLDPTDGLSYEEKKWMNEYQAKYIQALADVYNKVYGSDPILVNNGEVTYPTSLTSNNIFSHTVQWIDQTPSHGDLRISGWKSGIGNGFYEASEEFALIDDIRFYQYRVAYGKTGYCNFEMSSLNDYETFSATFSKVYEAGVNFITLFNDKHEYNTASMISELDNSLFSNPETATVHYDVSLFNIDYNRDASYTDLLTEKRGVVAYDNIIFDSSDGALKVKDASKPASVTYRITDNGKEFENGIYFDLEAMTTGTNRIFVYGGSSVDSLTLIDKFTYDRTQANSFNKNSIQRFDVIDSTRGLTEYYIELRFEVTKAEQGTVKSLIVRRPFENISGQKNGVSFTKGERRLINLWISSREEAERLYNSYVEKNDGTNEISETISALIEMGLPSDSVQLASVQTAKLIPATFAVTGEGQLGEFPVYIKLNSSETTAVVTLMEFSDSVVSFEVSSTYQFNDRARRLDMTFTELKSGSYKLVQTGWNQFRVEASSDSDAVSSDENGNISFKVQVEYDQNDSYTELQGRVHSVGNGVLKIIVQNPEISEYTRYIPVDMGTKCEYERHQEGISAVSSDKPAVGDYVVLSFGEDGTLIKCVAVYGEKTGIIKSFTPPDSTDADTSNGLIELEDGSIYELEYQTYTTKISFNGETPYYARSMTTSDMLSVFQAGKAVTITYCPEYYGEYQRLLTITG